MNTIPKRLILSLLFIYAGLTSVKTIAETSVRINLHTTKNPDQTSYFFSRAEQMKDESIIDYYPNFNQMPELKDTVKQEFHQIEHFYKKYSESLVKGKSIVLTLESKDLAPEFQKLNYVFPQTVSFEPIPQTSFQAQRHFYYLRDEHGLNPLSDNLKIAIAGDTIFTFNYPSESGGITPEGQIFRLLGKELERIETKSKVIFDVQWGIVLDGRDDITVHLYTLESNWENYNVDPYSYRLPLVKEVVLRQKTIEDIKQKAIKTFKEENFNTIEPYKKFKEKFQYRIFKAKCAKELQLLFDLRYFITHISVIYKDGSQKNWIHVADYVVNLP